MIHHPQAPEQDQEHTIFERRDPLIGTTLDGRFRIDARLAAGGFGSIYRGTELASGRELALKVLHANLVADESIVARFRREGETLASLRDPHTVTAYELGEAEDGTLYIAMELLRGETLHDALREHGGPLPWRRVAAIARAVCSSLAEAHERGIVHRDLKPANIHLEERGGERDFVKVLDFGIAKVLSGSDLDTSELTLAGQMIGTFDYMAPEQMLGGVVGPSCDIYTLGVVMYEMISGRMPFADAASPTHLLALLLTTEPPSLASRAPVPPALDRIVLRCLAREPQDRFASAVELAAALDRALGAGAPDAGAPEEATRTAVSRAVADEEATRVVRGGEARSAAAPAAMPARLTPSRGARLRDAIAPACPIEPIGDVRAQGSQPVIAPYAARGRAAQPAAGALGDASDATVPGTRPARAAQHAHAHATHAHPQQHLAHPQQHPAHPQQHAAHPQLFGYPQGVDPRVAVYPGPDAAGRSSLVMMPAYAIDPRAYAPAADAGAPWAQPNAAWRRADAGFDAARDAAVRRVVWALVLVFGCVLALVVANLL
ncbi:MAG TPA: serine/threonine-protein kinase [Kofleriaceae bacterium]|nr:serine/threonine-protein kinase [Kofleriaceae bacterium]